MDTDSFCGQNPAPPAVASPSNAAERGPAEPAATVPYQADTEPKTAGEARPKLILDSREEISSI